jgi:hypothetical protein
MALSRIDTTNMIEDVPQSKLDNNINFRNIIINGDMSIAQRGTSFSVSDNIYTLDRFLTEFSGFGAFTLTQSTDAPDGFGHSLKLDCTTADASPASGDVFQLFHRIEGQNLQYLKKGTSSAESTTLSFFVKSNKTGNMQVNLRDAPNNRIIGGVYTINTANTWEKKTLTFAGDTSGTIDNDNTEGLSLEFPIGSGSDNSSGSVPTTWKTRVNADRNAGSTINLADNTANEWYITGVQLEAGEVASDFEFLPHDVNLKRCQRYFGKSYSQGTNPGTDTWTGTVITRNLDSSNRGELPYLGSFGVSMRTVPTMTIYSKVGNIGKIVTGSTSMNAGSTEYSVGSLYVSQLQLTGIQATVTGLHFAQCHYTADAEL